MENKTCETREKQRSCDGCFGASFGDCQRCQESREKEETTVGYKTEEFAKAVQVLLSCAKWSVEEDIELVRRNPSLSFLQKLRIIRKLRNAIQKSKDRQ